MSFSPTPVPILWKIRWIDSDWSRCSEPLTSRAYQRCPPHAVTQTIIHFWNLAGVFTERKSEVARSSGLGSFSLRFAAIWKYRTSFLNWKFCTDKRRYLNSLLNNTQDPSWISDLPNVDLAVREGQSEFLEECAWKWPTIVLRLWTASRWVDFDWSLPRYLCSLPLSLAILTASSQMSYGVRKYRLGIGIPKIPKLSGPTRLNPDSACFRL